MKRKHLLAFLLAGSTAIGSAQTVETLSASKTSTESESTPKFEDLKIEPLTFTWQMEGDSKKKGGYVPRYGVDIAYIRLLSARTRRVFGNNTGWNFGPGLGPVAQRGGLQVNPDFDFFNASRKINGRTNKIFTATAGLSVRYTFSLGPGGPPDGPGDGEGGPEGGPGDGGGPPSGLLMFLMALSPYVEFGAGLTYADISARSENIYGKRTAYSASFAVGTSITNRAFIQARYRYTPKILSFDMRTFDFEFGIRF